MQAPQRVQASELIQMRFISRTRSVDSQSVAFPASS